MKCHCKKSIWTTKQSLDIYGERFILARPEDSVRRSEVEPSKILKEKIFKNKVQKVQFTENIPEILK